MAHYEITKTHQDGTIEASIGTARIAEAGVSREIPMPPRLIPISRKATGWAHEDARGRIVYGPVSRWDEQDVRHDRYFARVEGAPGLLEEIDFSPYIRAA